MNDQEQSAHEREESLTDEFVKLGENIRGIVKTVWESDESIRVRQDVKKGLVELEHSLDKLSDELNESQAAQRIREEMEDLTDRVRSGEVETTVRSSMMSALKHVNAEIEKFSKHHRQDDTEKPTQDSQ